MGRALFFLMSLMVLLTACGHKKAKDHVIIPTSNFLKLEDEIPILPSWPQQDFLIVQINSEPDNLHPVKGNSSVRSDMFKLIHQTLLKINPENQNIEPSLSKTLPEISGDGKNYSFELKNNQKWEDESSLSVDDILFTFKVNMLPQTANPALASYWSNVQDVTQDGTNPLKFHLFMKEKLTQNISFLTSFPVLERKFFDPQNNTATLVIKNLNDSVYTKSLPKSVSDWTTQFNDEKYGHNPAFISGLGNYKVKSWEAGQYITLVKKKVQSSDDGSAAVNKIIYKINRDENSTLLELCKQEIDISMSLSMQNFIELSEDSIQQQNYSCILMPTYNYTYLAFNEKPDGKKHSLLFENKEIRKAIAELVPIQSILNVIFKQYSKQIPRLYSIVVPSKKEFNPSLKNIVEDKNSAAELLSKNGWTDSDKNGILDKSIDGKIVNFSTELIYLNTSPEWKDMAMLISLELKKSGLDIHPIPVDLNTFLTKAKTHDFDLLLGSWSGSALPEDYSPIWHSDAWKNNGFNYTGFGTQESDTLIDAIKAELNEEKRIELSKQLQKLIYDDQPYVFLYNNVRRIVIHKRLKNRIVYSERPVINLPTLMLH